MVTSPSGQTTVTTPTVPDPTVLTTEQLRREISWVKEFLLEEIHCKNEVTQTRLNGMDRAIVLFQELTDSLPALWQREVARLQELHEARLDTIATQFKERDTRIEQIAQLNKTAAEVSAQQNKISIDAALQAQEKAAGKQTESLTSSIEKSEKGFHETLNQIVALAKETTNGINLRLDDVRRRQDLLEGRSGGMGALVGWIFGAGSFLVAVVTIGAMFVVKS